MPWTNLYLGMTCQKCVKSIESKVIFIYSVTQSLCNSSLGDVVLDSSNMVYGDEDSIYDQTYEKQIFSAF